MFSVFNHCVTHTQERRRRWLVVATSNYLEIYLTCVPEPGPRGLGEVSHVTHCFNCASVSSGTLANHVQKDPISLVQLLLFAMDSLRIKTFQYYASSRPVLQWNWLDLSTTVISFA